MFYAQCLDRPAFRTHFHQEMSFSAFDRAMEDTILALNTGYSRTRDGTVLGRSKGKTSIVNPVWREKLDQLVRTLEGMRTRFRNATGFDESLYSRRRWVGAQRDPMMAMSRSIRSDAELGKWMDDERNKAILHSE